MSVGDFAEAQGVFLIGIDGPRSDDEFGSGFVTVFYPVFDERRITATPLRGEESYFIQGFHTEDPAQLVGSVIGKTGWQVNGSLFLRTVQLFNLPGGRTVDCEMPHNRHQVSRGEGFRRCPNGHRITNAHQVINCPVCALRLA